MIPEEAQGQDTHHTFLSGGGAQGALMRCADWSTSPLGHPAAWPQSLRTVVGLLLNSKFPMFIAWGPKLAFLYNDSYAEILGSKHPQAMGRPFGVVWEEIWDSIVPFVERALEGEATYQENLPLIMQRKGYDEQTWFTFSYSPVRDESGAVVGIHCACVETTAQVLAEKSRVDENERLRALFEQAPGFMAVLRGGDHVFELTNKAYLQLIGHRDLLGKTVRTALPEVAGQGFIDLLDRVFATGKPFVGRALPIKLQRKPGGIPEERFLDFVYQPIKDSSGTVTGIFAEGSDVTERTHAQRELQVSNQRKDEFLAMLAHELRNPLAPISSAAQVMQLANISPAQQKSASDIISRQAGHMTRLLDDLLDVSRVTRGLVVLKQQPTDINGVIDDAVEQVRSLVEQHGHRLTVIPLAEPACVLGDRTRLIQVVTNLLNNAARYTPAGGDIVVRAGNEAGQIVLQVSDNGIGIAHTVLPHIFELFTQSERSPDRSQGGLGIGLALVRHLVSLHGGKVEAHSDGPGKGSRFVLRLPRFFAEGSVTAPPETPMTRPEPALRILIVDDNVDAADTLAMVVEAEGHQALVEYDAHSTIQRALAESPQVLFIDIGLPDMDGYELARRIRAMPQTANATLVALTGYGQSQDRERSASAGFDYHLVKPADIAQIIAVISEARQRLPY
jgi:PAS domain S-box-containing protein